MDLLPRNHITPETAGPYAGLLASSFMAGRTLSSYPWGRLADVYGRKCVLLSSLTLSAVFSLLFGMSQSFRAAMLWRFLLGLSNGIVGTVKTVVSEFAASAQAQPPEDITTGTTPTGGRGRGEGGGLETRMMGLVVGMRAWGFLISPAIGGWLAEPIRQYPGLFQKINDNHNDSDSDVDSNSTGVVVACLTRYPFVLPNLVGAVLCLGTALVVGCCIHETLPREQLRSIRCIPNDLVAYFGFKLSDLVGCCRRRRTEEQALMMPPSDNHGDSETVINYTCLIDRERNSKETTSSSSSNNASTSSSGRMSPRPDVSMIPRVGVPEQTWV